MPFRRPTARLSGWQLSLLSANTQKGKSLPIPGALPSFFLSDSGHLGLLSLLIHSSPGRRQDLGSMGGSCCSREDELRTSGLQGYLTQETFSNIWEQEQVTRGPMGTNAAF